MYLLFKRNFRLLFNVWVLILMSVFIKTFKKVQWLTRVNKVCSAHYRILIFLRSFFYLMKCIWILEMGFIILELFHINWWDSRIFHQIKRSGCCYDDFFQTFIRLWMNVQFSPLLVVSHRQKMILLSPLQIQTGPK